MPRKLKVHAGIRFTKGKQQRIIVAATSIKQACEAARISAYHYRAYWNVTGNAEECEVALKNPGVAYYRSLDGDEKFKIFSSEG